MGHNMRSCEGKRAIDRSIPKVGNQTKKTNKNTIYDGNNTKKSKTNTIYDRNKTKKTKKNTETEFGSSLQAPFPTQPT